MTERETDNVTGHDQPIIEHAIEVVEDKIEHVSETHPRLRGAFAKSWPILRVSLYGAAFVGGGMLFARLFGGRAAERLGRRGGEGFAQGVADVQRIASRGSRWG